MAKMEERGAPVRALDGTGPDLATPLPAQTPHRPTRADHVNPQLTDPFAPADVDDLTLTDSADAWSTAEAEAVRSDPRGPAAAEMTAEVAQDVSDTWSVAEAGEVKFEITDLADPAATPRSAPDGMSKSRPAEAHREQEKSEPAESLLVGRLGGGVESLSVGSLGGGVESHSAEREGDGETSDPAEGRGDHAEARSVESRSVERHGDGETSGPAAAHGDHAESPPAERHSDGDVTGSADAHRDGDKPQPYKLRRAAACAILFIAVITTLLGVLLVIAAVTEDSAIERHTGRADAEVVDVTTHRTLVRFQTPDGAEHVPNVGVLYPEALEEGQVVRVEYDLREPDLVRVAGRGATLTFLPAFTTLFAVWAVTVGLVWWLRKPGPLHLRSLRARRKLAV